MNQKIFSEGECCYCNQMIDQDQITKHLNMHLSNMQKEHSSLDTYTFCHISVEAGEMFLHLLVKGREPMKKIDNFLRAIWLDCCGHLSGFKHKMFKVKMSDKVQEVMEPRVKVLHEYDYGTTTTVQLTAHKHYQLFSKDAIQLLSRNEPLKFMCDSCKKEPAETLCSVCICEGQGFLCKKCSTTHSTQCPDFEDYARMPLVNSPRYGECGYEGGSIDIQRDGVWKPKNK
jgi:CRISPR/Cas system-associated protein Cas10 (large subunit of type III CRISPR-Cas system)